MDLGLDLQGGNLQPLPANASKDQQTAVINDIINRLNLLLKTNVLADNSNKRFIMGYSKGRWPDGDFGIALSAPGKDVSTAPFGELIFAWDFATNTQYWVDPLTGKNYMQVGTLPDGSGGWHVAATGYNVQDAF